MKNGQSLNQLQQKNKENPEVAHTACYICNKLIAGAYGQTWIGGKTIWSCSRLCEQKVKQLKQGELDDFFAKNIC